MHPFHKISTRVRQKGGLTMLFPCNDGDIVSLILLDVCECMYVSGGESSRAEALIAGALVWRRRLI
jgi:hypothetical protein